MLIRIDSRLYRLICLVPLVLRIEHARVGRDTTTYSRVRWRWRHG